MKVELKDISRRFGQQWIFQNINYSFEEGSRHAILGGNGSGKSTLIKIIFGALGSSSGKVLYHSNNKPLTTEQSPFRTALAAPYLELLEELSALEFLYFYQKFRPLQNGMNSEKLLGEAMLTSAADKEIRNFSSGMKQRLRLALAIFSKASLILLDEPTSNLDPAGVEWYRQLISRNCKDRTIIIGSNFNDSEMDFCQEQLRIEDYKYHIT